MPMKITSLVENARLATRPDLVAEHGVSLHVAWGERSILFDTGASEAFAENARQLGVSIPGVTHAVLSHYHYDHGGGLPRFLAENHQAPLYLRPPPDGACVARALGGLITRAIDIDRGLLEAHRDRCVHVEGRIAMTEGATALGDISRAHPTPAGNRLLWLRREGRYDPDPFAHELLLVLEGDEGLVVLTGCSHRGILNMVDTVREAFPGAPIRALLGGFHLIGVPLTGARPGSRAEIEALGHRLAALPIQQIFTFHCTGTRGYRILADLLGDRLAPFPTGSTVTL